MPPPNVFFSMGLAVEQREPRRNSDKKKVFPETLNADTP